MIFNFFECRRARLIHSAICFLLFLGGFSSQAQQFLDADVCVYGGTSAGVVAAVQAARMGKTVVLHEF
jgi:ribulose 1,5-bisphosphate synthetase/thiazole synthase